MPFSSWPEPDEEDDMKYEQKVMLTNGKEALIRNCTGADGSAVLDVFTLAHEQTDYLLSYPDEKSFNAEQEAGYLEEKMNSPDEIELAAIIDGKIVGIAGIGVVGRKYKVRHRADFGISVLKEYWGLGLGRILTKACIQCARKTGYQQLELNVVAENERAVSLYRSVGFQEFGRNPRGFNSRFSGYQELVYMLLELDNI